MPGSLWRLVPPALLRPTTWTPRTQHARLRRPGPPALCPSCRGTASLQNVLSDVKAWRVTHMPRRRHRARAVTVHAGAPARLLAAAAMQASGTCAALNTSKPGPNSCTPSPRRLLCFAGFYGAWLSGGFNRRVMDRLREVQAAAEGPLRFWVTGAWVPAECLLRLLSAC